MKDYLYVAIERPPSRKEGFVYLSALDPSHDKKCASESVYLVLEHGNISCWRSEGDYKENSAPADESMPIRDCVIQASGCSPGVP